MRATSDEQLQATRRCVGAAAGSRGRGDRGSVTVELAAALPAVVLVLGLVLAAVGWSRMAVTATESAAVGARLAAVEGAEAARAEIARSVPGASVDVSVGAERVRVTVHIDGPGWLPVASATSVARVPS